MGSPILGDANDAGTARIARANAMFLPLQTFAVTIAGGLLEDFHERRR